MSMSMPKRIRLSRKKGWRKPANTVVVSRPSMFSNPFWKGYGCRLSAVWKYQVSLTCACFCRLLRVPYEGEHAKHFERIAENLHTLKGKNLACWCPIPGYCHANVL